MPIQKFLIYNKSSNFIGSFSVSALVFVSFLFPDFQLVYAAGPANVTGGNMMGPGPASGGPGGAGAGTSMGGGGRGQGNSGLGGGAAGNGSAGSAGVGNGAAGNSSAGTGSGGNGAAGGGSVGGSASGGLAGSGSIGSGSAGSASGGGSMGSGSAGNGGAVGGSMDGGGGAPAGWIPAWVPAGWAPAAGWAAAAQSGQRNGTQGQAAANSGGDGASPFVEILNVEFEVRPKAGFEPKCPVLLQILEESFRNSRAKENKSVGEAPLVWLADSFVLRHTSRNIAVWRAVLKPTFSGCEGEAVISAIDGTPYRAKNSHLKLFFRRGYVFLAVDVSKVGKNSVITARRVTDGGVPVWSWLDTSS